MKNIILVSMVVLIGLTSCFLWNQKTVCPGGKLNETGDGCEGQPPLPDQNGEWHTPRHAPPATPSKPESAPPKK